jgi:integrase
MKRASCNVRMTPKGWIEYDIVAVWPNGEHERERRQCPLQTMTGARAWAKERERELYALGPPSTRKARARVTWAKFWIEFKRLHFTSGPRGALKPSQVASIESHWTHHIAPFWGWRALDDTTAHLVLEWLTALQAPAESRRGKIKTARRPKTINNILITFNTMLSRAEEWEIAPRGLPRAKLLRVAKPEIEFYHADELRQLLEGAWRCGLDVAIAVLLGARAGLRAGEIIGLRGSDVAPHRDELLIQRSIWKGKIHAPKSGKPRRVPIPEDLAAHLRAVKGYVLANKDGSPLSGRQLQHLVRRAELAAGIADASGRLHRLRHTYASLLVMKGAPLAVVQALLGHAEIATTMRYAHLSPGALEDAVKLLGDGGETMQARAITAGKSGVSDGA